MIKRLLCKHLWRMPYRGEILPNQYACVKCGIIKRVYSFDEGAWKVQREAKGDSFE